MAWLWSFIYFWGKFAPERISDITCEGFKEGFSKRQISNLFSQQSVLLQSNLNPVDVLTEYNGNKEGGVTASFFEDSSLIPDPKTLNPNDKNLLILDDCYLGKQSKAEAYYSRGRHNNCDTIYISQNYFRLPRQTIRENSNFIILFPQDAKNLNHIHADHCSDISKEEFINLCERSWTIKHNFVTIDLRSSKNGGKYRRNLDSFYIPTSW